MAPDEIIDERIGLLPLRADDVSERYVSWLNDPGVMRFTEAGHQRHTLESVRKYVADAEADPRVRLWRIFDDGAHVGNLRLSSIDSTHMRCELALIIGEKSRWGSGLGAVAIGLATRYAFDHLKLRKVSALIYASNHRSLRAFEKAGYREDARLRAHFLDEYGEGVDGVWMCRFAGDE